MWVRKWARGVVGSACHLSTDFIYSDQVCKVVWPKNKTTSCHRCFFMKISNLNNKIFLGVFIVTGSTLSCKQTNSHGVVLVVRSSIKLYLVWTWKGSASWTSTWQVLLQHKSYVLKFVQMHVGHLILTGFFFPVLVLEIWFTRRKESLLVKKILQEPSWSPSQITSGLLPGCVQ